MRLPSKHFIRAVLPALLFLWCSCTGDDSPTEPDYEFLFRVIVRDADGFPVPDLQVSVWNHLGTRTGVATPPVRSAPRQYASSSTTIQFALPRPCYVALQVLDLKGRVQKTLASRQFEVGTHQVEFIADEFRSGVYPCRLVARETAGGPILFQDTIYTVLHRAPDSDETAIGWTSANGRFQTTDDLIFPNLFPLPPLVETGAFGPEPVTTFNILDTVTIVLTDTSTAEEEEYQRVVRPGINEFILQWGTTKSSRSSLLPSRTERLETGVAQNTSPPAVNHNHDWSTISILDNDGRRQQLLFGPPDSTDNLSRFDAPPPPPEGSFDVRYASQRYAERSAYDSTRDFRILITGPSFPITISWDYNDSARAICPYLRVNNRDHALFRDGSIVLDTTTTRVILRIDPRGPCIEPPDRFRLFENFPNPFK